MQMEITVSRVGYNGSVDSEWHLPGADSTRVRDLSNLADAEREGRLLALGGSPAEGGGEDDAAAAFTRRRTDKPRAPNDASGEASASTATLEPAPSGTLTLTAQPALMLSKPIAGQDSRKPVVMTAGPSAGRPWANPSPGAPISQPDQRILDAAFQAYGDAATAGGGQPPSGRDWFRRVEQAWTGAGSWKGAADKIASDDFPDLAAGASKEKSADTHAPRLVPAKPSPELKTYIGAIDNALQNGNLTDAERQSLERIKQVYVKANGADNLPFLKDQIRLLEQFPYSDQRGLEIIERAFEKKVQMEEILAPYYAKNPILAKDGTPLVAYNAITGRLEIDAHFLQYDPRARQLIAPQDPKAAVPAVSLQSFMMATDQHIYAVPYVQVMVSNKRPSYDQAMIDDKGKMPFYNGTTFDWNPTRQDRQKWLAELAGDSQMRDRLTPPTRQHVDMQLRDAGRNGKILVNELPGGSSEEVEALLQQDVTYGRNEALFIAYLKQKGNWPASEISQLLNRSDIASPALRRTGGRSQLPQQMAASGVERTPHPLEVAGFDLSFLVPPPLRQYKLDFVDLERIPAWMLAAGAFKSSETAWRNPVFEGAVSNARTRISASSLVFSATAVVLGAGYFVGNQAIQTAISTFPHDVQRDMNETRLQIRSLAAEFSDLNAKAEALRTELINGGITSGPRYDAYIQANKARLANLDNQSAWLSGGVLKNADGSPQLDAQGLEVRVEGSIKVLRRHNDSQLFGESTQKDAVLSGFNNQALAVQDTRSRLEADQSIVLREALAKQEGRASHELSDAIQAGAETIQKVAKARAPFDVANAEARTAIAGLTKQFPPGTQRETVLESFDAATAQFNQKAASSLKVVQETLTQRSKAITKALEGAGKFDINGQTPSQIQAQKNELLREQQSIQTQLQSYGTLLHATIGELQGQKAAIANLYVSQANADRTDRQTDETQSQTGTSQAISVVQNYRTSIATLNATLTERYLSGKVVTSGPNGLRIPSGVVKATSPQVYETLEQQLGSIINQIKTPKTELLKASQDPSIVKIESVQDVISWMEKNNPAGFGLRQQIDQTVLNDGLAKPVNP
jgi:hypothetical protein